MTYFFPVVTNFGLMSVDFRTAKNNSQGQLSYEYGPVNMIGILSASNICRLSALTWYGALSAKIMVLRRQLVRWRSRIAHSSLKKRPMVWELLLL